MAGIIIGTGYGLFAVMLNYYLLCRFLEVFTAKKKTVGLFFVLSYLGRYLLFGLIIFAFLKFRLGSLAGLFAGVTAGVVLSAFLGRRKCQQFPKP